MATTRRLAKSAVDWAKFSKGIADAEKELFRSLKARSDTYVQRVQGGPEVLPKIDWQFYQNQVSVPGLVDKFKQNYDKVDVPFPQDTAGLGKSVRQEGDQLTENIKETNKSLHDHINMSNEFLTGIDKYLPDPMSTTADELIEFFPSEKMNQEKPMKWPFTPQTQPGVRPNEAP